MWSVLRVILEKWALLKVLRGIASLVWLIPLAAILKLIGLPLLFLLAIVAVPLFIVLAVIGLPLFAVLLLGGALLSIVFGVVSLGLTVLKLAIPVFLIYWLLRWLFWSEPRRDPPPVTDM